MNTKMGTWYRVADLSPKHEELQKRSDAIEAYLAEDVEPEDILHLVRAFFDSSFSSEYIERFINFFVDKDNAFDLRNSVEISVLAGITLHEIAENYTADLSSIVFLAVASASFPSKISIVPDIQSEILELFDEIRIESRENLFKQSENKIIQISTEKIVELLCSDDGADWNAEIAELLADYINTANTSFNSLLGKVAEYEKYTEIYSDDSQVLWWLVGKWSNDFQRPFSEFEEYEASFYAGKELADIVQFLPGLYTAKAVLVQILSNCKTTKSKYSLSEIVNDVNLNWKEKTLHNYDPSSLLNIAPILLALLFSTQFEENDQWISGFKKSIDIDPKELIMEAHAFSYQIYIECLLVKAMEEGA